MAPDHRPGSVGFALVWSAILGGFIGGCCLTLWSVIDGSAYGIYESPWLALVAPFAFAGLSLIVLVPTTLVFGLPSALLIKRFRLRKRPALALCLGAAFATQIGSITLMSPDQSAYAAQFLISAPFAFGAAVILWWRLTRLPSYRADHPRSR